MAELIEMQFVKHRIWGGERVSCAKKRVDWS